MRAAFALVRVRPSQASAVVHGHGSFEAVAQPLALTSASVLSPLAIVAAIVAAVDPVVRRVRPHGARGPRVGGRVGGRVCGVVVAVAHVMGDVDGGRGSRWRGRRRLWVVFAPAGATDVHQG